MSISSSSEIWRERIANYRSSNLKAKEWCNKNNLSLSTLRYWIHKFNKETATSDDFSSGFVPVTSSGIMIHPSTPIVIRIGKISIDVTDGCHPDTLHTVLEALGTYA